LNGYSVGARSRRGPQQHLERGGRDFERYLQIDVFGNDIFDTSIDGFEGDPGGTNIRVWGTHPQRRPQRISFQPQNNSPWYILRNQLVGFMEAPFKFRTRSSSPQPIVTWSKMICCNDAHLLRSIVKNNLCRVSGGQIWIRVDCEDWRSDFNNDGFTGSKHGAVQYGGVVYSSPGLAAASGSRRTDDRSIGRRVSHRSMCLALRPCRFRRRHDVDRRCAPSTPGDPPNINDGFVGTGRTWVPTSSASPADVRSATCDGLAAPTNLRIVR